MHREMIPNGSDWKFVDVKDGFHYEMKCVNGQWKYILTSDFSDQTITNESLVKQLVYEVRELNK